MVKLRDNVVEEVIDPNHVEAIFTEARRFDRRANELALLLDVIGFCSRGGKFHALGGNIDARDAGTALRQYDRITAFAAARSNTCLSASSPKKWNKNSFAYVRRIGPRYLCKMSGSSTRSVALTSATLSKNAASELHLSAFELMHPPEC